VDKILKTKFYFGRAGGGEGGGRGEGPNGGPKREANGINNSNFFKIVWLG